MRDEGAKGLALHFYPTDAGIRRLSLEADAQRRLAVAVERAGALSELACLDAPHVSLLIEARQLYVWGYDYGCVAMCGIAAERIAKDIFAAALRIQQGESVVAVSSEAINHAERLNIRSMTSFLWSAGLIPEDCARAAHGLADLRNRYAHGGGDAAAVDAMRALSLLDRIVHGTVSVAHRLEIRVRLGQVPFPRV